MKKHFSRRHFLKQASCAAIGSTTLLSTLTNLKFINAASISNSSVIGGSDYKAMVCILMSGGNDSFNMLVPTESGAYNTYRETRSNLALAKDSLLPLNNTALGVHPSMGPVQELFNQGQLSMISNIGTLIAPVTKQEAMDFESSLPLGLFSHADQAQQWQTSIPNDRSSVGWGGRVADMMQDVNDNRELSINISVSGSNLFQTGSTTVEYALDPSNGAVGILEYNDPNGNAFWKLRDKAIDNMIDAHYDDIYKKAYIDVIKNSRDVQQEVAEALNTAPFLDDLFSDNDFSIALRTIAKTIATRDKLGMKRQIFFVDYDKWDHHDEVLETQAEMLDVLAKGLSEFNAALDRISANDCVTTFTSSEFGRTLTSNGQGTDHAWGGNVMVMGGPVKGGKVYGEYPSLELGGNQDLGKNATSSNGIMIPTTSVDAYFAELALWFGVSASELKTIFPNIGNFYDTGSGDMPIGFLG